MNEDDFTNWLAGASIYIGYDRYGLLGVQGFVCATVYDESEELREAVDNLNAGDQDALSASNYIKATGTLVGSSKVPAIAMMKMESAARLYYNHALNGEPLTMPLGVVNPDDSESS